MRILFARCAHGFRSCLVAGRARVHILAVAFPLSILLPAGTLASGPAGSASDHLDAPGAPTDRYLDAKELLTVLHGANDRFYQCFRTHLRGGADPGDVVVTFTVDRSGMASEAEAEMSAGFRSLAGCLEGVVKGLEFGEHDGEPVPASYPLVYQVDRKGARVVPYPTVFVRPSTLRLPLLSLPPDIGPGEVRMLEHVLFETGDIEAAEASPETAPESDSPSEREPSQRP